MGAFQAGVLETVAAALTVAALTGMWAWLRSFVREQRAANEANAKANRAMQKAEITRLFNAHVERAEPMSVRDMELLEDVYAAYHANGGNGAATAMYGRIRENARITTEGPVRQRTGRE